MQITQAQADKLLMDDLARFERAVDQGVKVPLTDNQFGALVSVAFNVGVAAFEKFALLRTLNVGDYNSVPSEHARWVNAGGR
ncbi:lysozyme [Pseudochelatococcus sp. G4_1912]|uniref:lysozyme n=1 Tax=Pseudochelatococcus sp. G4_1912 TaxID=3114288 RepID=UPI0039C695D1